MNNSDKKRPAFRFTWPNIISLFRIAISPVFYFLLISGDSLMVSIGCIVFLIGAYSDYLDGMLARKYHEVTPHGVFIDPLADKVLTTAAFIAFMQMGIIELWMVVIILIRDFSTTLLRVYGEKADMPIRTSNSAKFKTFLQMVFIGAILMVLFMINSFDVESFKYFLSSDIIHYSMLFLTILTVWTLVEYLISNRNVIKKLCSSENNR